MTPRCAGALGLLLFAAAAAARGAAGAGAPRPDPRALALATPRPVRWLAPLEPGRLVALDAGGGLAVVELGPAGLALRARHEGVVAAESAPAPLRCGAGGRAAAAVAADGRLTLWTPGGLRTVALGVPLSTYAPPLAVPVAGAACEDLLAIDQQGALVLVTDLAATPRVAARLEVDALPDARVVALGGDEVAVLAAPTRRYRHGALGDRFEASAVILAAVGPGRLTQRGRFIEPPESVLEDLRVIPADVDGDGRPELLVSRSYRERGAAVLVLARTRRGWRPLAESEPVGAERRWRHTLGAADLDGDGRVEIVSVRTPHQGGVVEAWRRAGERLTLVANHAGAASHVPGSRNVEQAALGDVDGDGRPEVVVPAPARDALVGLALAPGGFQGRWRHGLGGPLASNVVVADLDGDGRVDLAVADEGALHVRPADGGPR